MTTYTATFRADDQWAEREFEADTPEQALKLARAFHDDHDEELMFQSYDGGMPVNEIEISGPDGSELAVWRDDHQRLQLAAGGLLDACKVAVERLELSNCQGEERPFIDTLHAAIAEAASDAKTTSTNGPGKPPADPQGRNDARAERAGGALRHFQCVTGTDDEDSLGDLLCDLMHWSDRNNFDFDAALFRARIHYKAETTDDAG